MNAATPRRKRPPYVHLAGVPATLTEEQAAAREAEIARMVRAATIEQLGNAALITTLRAIDRVRGAPDPWTFPTKEDYPGVEGACLLLEHPAYWIKRNAAVKCATLLRDDFSARWAALNERKATGIAPSLTTRWTCDVSEAQAIRALSMVMAVVAFDPPQDSRDHVLGQIAESLSLSSGATAIEDLRPLLVGDVAAE